MEERGNGEIPCSVGGHYKAKKWPDSVIVKWRNKDCGCTTSPKDVSPSPLVQVIIYVIYVAATSKQKIPNSRELIVRGAWLIPPYLFGPNNFKIWIQIRAKSQMSRYLAQAMSWMTDPNRRKVQLNAKPTFLQCFPRSPSRTSNH